MPRRVRKRIRIGPSRVRAFPQEQEIGKKTSTNFVLNNPRSSIKPGSAPDLK